MTTVNKHSPLFGVLFVVLLSGRFVGQQSEQANSAPTQTPTAQSPLRVRVSQGVSAGLLVKRVNPEYPKELRKKGIQGPVTLKILISREGDVSQVTLVSGDPALAPGAIEAVKQWKYKPYLLQGQPVQVETTVQINFTLAGM